MMDQKTKRYITLFAIIILAALALASVMSWVEDTFKGGGIFNFSGIITKQREVDQEKSADINGVKTLNIRGVSEKITLFESEDDEIRVEFYGKYSAGANYEPELFVSTSGGELTFEVRNKNGGTNHNVFFSDFHLDVYLPADYKNGFNLYSVSGGITFSDLTGTDFRCETVSGSITGKHLIMDEVQFRSTSGRILVNDCEISGELVVNTISGEITVDRLKAEKATFGTVSGQTVFGGSCADIRWESVSGSLDMAYDKVAGILDIRADTTSGSVKISLPEDSGFKLAFTTVSGGFRTDFPENDLKKQSINKGRTGTVSDGSGNVEVSTVSGSLELTKW